MFSDPNDKINKSKENFNLERSNEKELISSEKNRINSIERKAHIQKDIVNLLENSLLLSKSKKSNSQIKHSMVKENIIRSSSQEAPSKYKLRAIQTDQPITSPESKKETLSK